MFGMEDPVARLGGADDRRRRAPVAGAGPQGRVQLDLGRRDAVRRGAGAVRAGPRADRRRAPGRSRGGPPLPALTRRDRGSRPIGPAGGAHRHHRLSGMKCGDSGGEGVRRWALPMIVNPTGVVIDRLRPASSRLTASLPARPRWPSSSRSRERAAAEEPKVVLIVGPAGEATARYRRGGRGRADARATRRTSSGSTRRTPPGRRSARARRGGHRRLPRPRQRLAEPLPRPAPSLHDPERVRTEPGRRRATTRTSTSARTGSGRSVSSPRTRSCSSATSATPAATRSPACPRGRSRRRSQRVDNYAAGFIRLAPAPSSRRATWGRRGT